jgi:hypothetical protein
MVRVAVVRIELGADSKDQLIDALARFWLCLKSFAAHTTGGLYGPVIFEIGEAEIPL